MRFSDHCRADRVLAIDQAFVAAMAWVNGASRCRFSVPIPAPPPDPALCQPRRSESIDGA